MSLREVCFKSFKESAFGKCGKMSFISKLTGGSISKGRLSWLLSLLIRSRWSGCLGHHPQEPSGLPLDMGSSPEWQACCRTNHRTLFLGRSTLFSNWSSARRFDSNPHRFQVQTWLERSKTDKREERRVKQKPEKKVNC